MRETANYERLLKFNAVLLWHPQAAHIVIHHRQSATHSFRFHLCLLYWFIYYQFYQNIYPPAHPTYSTWATFFNFIYTRSQKVNRVQFRIVRMLYVLILPYAFFFLHIVTVLSNLLLVFILSLAFLPRALRAALLEILMGCLYHTKYLKKKRTSEREREKNEHTQAKRFDGKYYKNVQSIYRFFITSFSDVW